MREFKFRAWDMICKPPRMKSWEQLLAQYQLTQIFASDFFKVMQYTGFKDMFGIEIYGGDILKAYFYDKWEDCSVSYGKVEFDVELGGWQAYMFNGENDYLSEWVEEGCEIIGNIHDNPNILKQAESGESEDFKNMEIKKLYELQDKLNKTILDKFELPMSKNELLSNTLLALQVEVSELANATRCFKHWSVKEAESKERLLDEYADVLHFFLSIGSQLDFTPDEVVQAYLTKNKENYRRLREGY